MFHFVSIISYTFSRRLEPRNINLVSVAFATRVEGQRVRSKMSDASETGFVAVFRTVFKAYNEKTTKSMKVIDAYLLYVLVSGIIQFAYMLLVGTFPFNSFLAAFLSCVGVFVLSVALRMQINPVSRNDPRNSWSAVAPVRAYADWLFCNLILHMAVLNFLG